MQSTPDTHYWSVLPMISLAFLMARKKQKHQVSIKNKAADLKKEKL